MPAPLEYDFRVIGRAVVEREIAAIERRLIASAQRLNREFEKLAGGGGRRLPGGTVGGLGGGSGRFSDPAASLDRQRARGLYSQFKAQERASAQAAREEQRRIDNLNKSRQSLHNQRMREEKQARTEANRTDAQKQRAIDKESNRRQALDRQRTKEETQRQRSIDRESNRRLALDRQRAREEAAFRSSVATKADFVKSTVSSGVGRVASAVGSVGRAGLAIAGISAAGLAASSISQATTLDEGARRLVIAGRDPGEKGLDHEKLVRGFVQTGIATGVSPESVLSGVREYVAKTGDLKTALAMQNTFATTAQGGDADVKDIFSMGAAMGQSLKIKDPEQIKEAFAIFSQQGKKGKFELKDVATEGAELLTAAGTYGMTGVQGARDIGAFAQIAMLGNNSKSEATTSLMNMFAEVAAKADKLQAGELFKGKKIQVYKNGDPTAGYGNMIDTVSNIVAASGGNQGLLDDVFNKRSIKTARVLSNAYSEASRAAGGGEKGDKAGREAVSGLFSKFRDLPASYESVQQDASDAMKSFSVQMEIINTKLKDIMASQLFPEIVKLLPQIEQLVPMVGNLTKEFIKLVSFVSNNPWTALVTALSTSLLLEIGKAALGSVVSKALASVIAAAAGGGIGAGGVVTAGQVLASGASAGGAGSAATAATAAAAAGAGLTKASFLATAGKALGRGAIGAGVGYGLGQLIGGDNGGSTGAWIGGGAGLGSMLGPVGALAGASLGFLGDQATSLYSEVWGSKSDKAMNEAAKAQALAEGRSTVMTNGHSQEYWDRVETGRSLRGIDEPTDVSEQKSVVQELGNAASALKDAAADLKGANPNRSDKPTPIK